MTENTKKTLFAATRTLLRLGAVALMFVGLLNMFYEESSLKTLMLCSQGMLTTIILAVIAQWGYTQVSFTRETCRPGDEAIDEIIVSARIRALGSIFLGTAVVVGFIYFATYTGGPIAGIVARP